MKPLKHSLALVSLLFSATFGADINLYTDTKTGQVFTTPGEGRVLLGEFTQKVSQSTEEIVPKVKKIQAPLQAQSSTLVASSLQAQGSIEEGMLSKAKPNWAEKLSVKGYLQFRAASFVESQGGNYTLWSDASTRKNNANFLIRRARVIISGDVGDHLGIYVQPDFASQGANLGQVRDFYGDIYIDKTKIHRIRVGQSKIPFGFENMQSSSKRMALDRNDALNSAARDERDTGAFYYYTPQSIQALFKEIDAARLRGSGNYGMFALGAYNGQGANRPELNGNVHAISRLTYPFKLDNGQFMEFGVQGYKGKYVPFTGDATAPSAGVEDERVGISAMIYPQPFGLQAEWNWGNTPGYDKDAKDAKEIMKKSLNGGYVQAMYMLDDFLKNGDTFTTFVRWQYFDGYSKAEPNAPRNEVDDWEIGTEWYPAKELRIQTVLHLMNRQDLTISNSRDMTGERFQGTAFRVQVQTNF